MHGLRFLDLIHGFLIYPHHPTHLWSSSLVDMFNVWTHRFVYIKPEPRIEFDGEQLIVTASWMHHSFEHFTGNTCAATFATQDSGHDMIFLDAEDFSIKNRETQQQL